MSRSISRPQFYIFDTLTILNFTIMKKLLLSALCMGLTLNVAFATNFNSQNPGNWTDANTWNTTPGQGAGTTYPGSGDDVFLAHAVDYDITNDTTIYNSITFNGGSELHILGDASVSNHTVLGLSTSLNLNGPLTLGPNTVFLLDGTLTVNSSGSITFEDKVSIFRMSSASANVQINSDITIENGIFALQANGSNSLTINGAATVTVGNNGSLYFEGSNGSFSIDGDLIFEEGSQFVADLNANLTANINGSVTFEYGSSFFQGDDVNKISISGNAPTWEIELTNKAEWRHISSPFEAPFTFNDLSTTDFNPNVNAGEENMFWWDASIIPSTTADSKGWTKVTSLTETFEAGGNSYTIYTGGPYYSFNNGGLVSIQHPVAYNDDYIYNLHNTIDTSTRTSSEGDQGWNLIGNPYPTWLNLDTLLKEEMGGEYQGAHMWDADAGQYQAYVIGGETIERTHDNTGSSVDSISNKYIRPFQAFWVKMDKTSGASKAINIDHTYRALNPAAAPPSYFSSTFIPRLRLNAYAASDSAWDQVLVVLNPNSNQARLGSEDAFDRASNNDRPNMALIHEDGERLCIDSRPLDSATVIPMTFEQGADGATYHIAMVDDQFDPIMSAFLEDVKTNTIHDLKNGAYSFVHDKGYTSTRFNIHLAPHYVSQSELQLVDNKFQIWTANDKLFVQLDKAGLNQNITVKVFDISGKLVFETSATAENTSLNIPLQMQAGAHIIKVSHPQYGSKVLKTIR